MTPEQLKQFQEMQSTLNQVVEFINKLGNIGTVPKEIGDAIAGRIVGLSSKTAASATRAVNEGASAQYSVMYPPTGFLTLSINGKNVDIPYI